MPREVKEWIGKTPDSMPSIHVQLRLYRKQNGICACPDKCGVVMDFDRDAIDCDHTIPLADDGENRESNLHLLLTKHHQKKTAAENVARGEERRHKAKAFTSKRGKKKSGRGFGQATPQRTATKRLSRKFKNLRRER